MKPLPLFAAALLLSTAATLAQDAGKPPATTKAPAPADKLTTAKAAENKAIALAELKREALATATRLYLKPKRGTPHGLLCDRREVIEKKTNKRDLSGAYLTTPEPGTDSKPPVLLLGEPPRAAGAAFVLVTVYPAPKPATVKTETECFTLTPEAAALAIYEARLAAE